VKKMISPENMPWGDHEPGNIDPTFSAEQLPDLVEHIANAQDADWLRSTALRLPSLLSRCEPERSCISALLRVWEQRTDPCREPSWEIRQVAWLARLQLESWLESWCEAKALVYEPNLSLVEKICQAIRHDPHPKALEELVDYPSWNGRERAQSQTAILLRLLEAWEQRVGENRPEDEGGSWILHRGLKCVRRKLQGGHWAE
jgi:hypothetical protein